jgi:hypothetical protein
MLPSPTKPTLSGTPHLSAIRCNPPRGDLGPDPMAQVIGIEANYHRLPPIHTAGDTRAEDGFPPGLCPLKPDSRRSAKV